MEERLGRVEGGLNYCRDVMYERRIKVVKNKFYSKKI